MNSAGTSHGFLIPDAAEGQDGEQRMISFKPATAGVVVAPASRRAARRATLAGAIGRNLVWRFLSDI
jgi:hypothetical protein